MTEFKYATEDFSSSNLLVESSLLEIAHQLKRIADKLDATMGKSE